MRKIKTEDDLFAYNFELTRTHFSLILFEETSIQALHFSKLSSRLVVDAEF